MSDLYLGDFAKVLDFIPDETADAIITDPPWSDCFMDCWIDLGKFAEKKLKPGGWLIAYSGNKHLPEVMNKLSLTLNYYWTICLFYRDMIQTPFWLDLAIRWKPILVYYKIPKKPLHKKNQLDYIVSDKKEKNNHKWQQSESGVRRLIEIFTVENDFIIEPFAGSGTTILVAKEMNRKVVGAEIDKNEYEKALQRIEKHNQNKKRFFHL